MAGKIQFLPTGMEPSPGPEREPPARMTSAAGSAALWRELLGHLDDDALHQAFIRACHGEGKLRFALDCYRTLEKMRPGDPIAARYLAQVAKAMEVSALGVTSSRQIDLQSRLLARPLRIIVGLVIGLGGMAAIYMAIQMARVALHR